MNVSKRKTSTPEPADPRADGLALFAEERRHSILARLRVSGKVTVAELTDAFGVSAPTVRADLAHLEEQGVLRRTHGGAIRADTTLFEPPYAQRQIIRHSEKRAIARTAAGLIKDGETILLDAGTTTHEIALRLRDRSNLTVVTNSIANALALMESSSIEVIMVGGAVQPRRRATLGPLAVAFLGSFRFDRAFLAFNGVEAEAGFTVVDFDAAEVKRQMMRRAEEVVVVADSAKIGRVAFAAVGPITPGRTLITDAGVIESEVDRLRERGMTVLLASV